MKKLLSTKKGKIISISSLVVICVVIAIFIGIYQKQAEEKRNQIAQVELVTSSFEKEEIRGTKLETLTLLISEYEEYKNGKSAYTEVSEKYDTSIASMKKYFLNEYNAIIVENTLNDVENIDDQETFNTANTALKTLLDLIKSEENIVSDENQVKEYNDKINALMESYTIKLDLLIEEEKIEAEKLAAEEAEVEAQRIENEKKQQALTNNGSAAQKPPVSNNGGNNTTPPATQPNNPPATGNWYDGMYYYWVEKQDGSISEFYVDMRTNKSYNMDGTEIDPENKWG